MPAIIKACYPCIKGPAQEFQDKQYGRNNRVMNTLSKPTTPTFRCTVCGKETT